jgi:E3 ubiquitin-protein ligase SHPRH
MVVHPFSSFFRERDNAGLNVTCASRVFLVESVVNHGFEVQGRFVPGLNVTIISPITAAIARIDRMGQTKPTEGVSRTALFRPTCFSIYIACPVFCYYAEGIIPVPEFIHFSP